MLVSTFSFLQSFAVKDGMEEDRKSCMNCMGYAKF